MWRLTFVLLLLLAAPAHALEVSQTSTTTAEERTCEDVAPHPGCPVGVPPQQVTVNHLVLHLAGASAGATVAIGDGDPPTVTGIGVTAGEGCDQVDATTVRCVDPPIPPVAPGVTYETAKSLEGALGPGDDVLTLTGTGGRTVTVDGGDGADTLTLQIGQAIGGAGDDVLTAPKADGGEGNDRLTTDERFGVLLVGGPGDDQLTGGGRYRPGPGHDIVTGGPATDDWVSAEEDSEPVVFDLTGAGRDGSDIITGVEVANGGPGADRLYGDGRMNRLNGYGGDDVMEGGGGTDTLYGGDGADRIRGGGGNDFVNGDAGADDLRGGAGNDNLNADGGGGTISGGPGDDTIEPGTGTATCGGGGRDGVFETTPAFVVGDDCERLSPFGRYPLPARPAFVAPHWLDVPLNGDCPTSSRCAMTVTIGTSRRHRVQLHGRRTTVRFRFGASRRNRPLAVRFRAVGPRGAVTRAGYTLEGVR